ncbi:TetR/AcrR family transcriptional regulator, partial [Acinetobacter baumannii]
YEALSIIQKYNLELIYKIILPIHNKISSEEYKERAIIIITQLNGYLVQHSNKNTDESYKEFLRSILLKNILRLVSEP